MKAVRYVYGIKFNCHCRADRSNPLDAKPGCFESEDRTLINFKKCPDCNAAFVKNYKYVSPDQLNVPEEVVSHGKGMKHGTKI